MTKKGYNDKEKITSSNRTNLNKNKKGNNLRLKRPSKFLKITLLIIRQKKQKNFCIFQTVLKIIMVILLK